MIEVRCNAADIPPGELKQIACEGRSPIAVCNVEGTFFAFDDTCTHGEASLCDGAIEGFIVECPFHSGTFDVRTGAAVGYPATVPLRSYPVSVEEGSIVIKIPDADAS